MTKQEKIALDKAYRIKKNQIIMAEKSVQETGIEYLNSVRFATMICLRYGQDSLAYKNSLKTSKRKLGRYMKAIEHLYDMQNFDIKEIL